MNDFHARFLQRTIFCCILALAPAIVCSKEMPIGKPQAAGGMEIAAVYLQPIEMDPPGLMRPATDTDIHLEADIKAAKDNKNGFAEGDWMPYLSVSYKLARLDGAKGQTEETQSGELMPMVANDGPHYGDNIKLAGPGKYKLELKISPPSAHTHFGRHIDKETGVGPWFEPIAVDYEFVYAGVGKKGGY